MSLNNDAVRDCERELRERFPGATLEEVTLKGTVDAEPVEATVKPVPTPKRRRKRRPGTFRERVLQLLADAQTPLKGEAITRRLGKGYCGHTKGVLSGLVKEGLLVLVEEGYLLAQRSLFQNDLRRGSDP